MTTPQYRIQIRDHSLTPLGELPDFIDGDLLLKFNDVGTWVLTVRADSPMAQYFARGNGVIVSRDRGDGSGAQTILSGPIWHLERQLQANTYVLAGVDDTFWLKARRAEPVTVAGNYAAAVTALTGLLRYYRLGETAGTTATDTKSAQNGTYTGGFTLDQAALVDDANPAALFNGTTGYVSLPTTGLPTGNAAWYLGCWFQLPNPIQASTTTLISFGNWGTTHAAPHISVNSSGGVIGATFGGDTVATAGLAAGSSHFALCQWDGTTLSLYVDGVLAQTATPGTLSVTLAGATIGAASNTTSGFFGGVLDEAFIGSGTLPADTVMQLYALGVSRFDASAYDTRTNTASTVIRQYVDNNAGPSALLARRVTGLTLAADPAIGSVAYGNERFSNLLAAIQQFAIQGGDIGFRVTQTDVGVLTFTIYQPATQSNAIFSRELGNLLDAVYTLDGPVGNDYVIGGGGDGTLRIFQTGQDSSSVSAWGLVEGDFLDARDTSDLPTLQQRLSAQLAQDAEHTNLTITPIDTAALQFGRDYNLGDVVSVQIDDTTITDIIRQLHITLNSNDQELVSPGIGNAGAGQITYLFDAKARALAAVQQKLARLSAAQ